MIDANLTLVLPAHNEIKNIERVVDNARQSLPGFFSDFEVLIVNDGSTDGTGEIADRLAGEFEQVRVIHHPRNRGYGAALASGFRGSSGDWVMVMDADQQFDIGDLVYFTPYIGEYDLVAGYRLQRNDPPHRVMFGRVFGVAVRTLFGLRLRDIDCAFKVMRGDMLRSLDFSSPGALVSTELFARWKQAGGNWIQVGVHHYPRAAGLQSGGSLRVIFRAMKEILVLWYRLNVTSRQSSGHPDGHNGQRSGISPGRAVAIAAAVFVTLVALLSRLLRRT